MTLSINGSRLAGSTNFSSKLDSINPFNLSRVGLIHLINVLGWVNSFKVGRVVSTCGINGQARYAYDQGVWFG